MTVVDEHPGECLTREAMELDQASIAVGERCKTGAVPRLCITAQQKCEIRSNNCTLQRDRMPIEHQLSIGKSIARARPAAKPRTSFGDRWDFSIVDPELRAEAEGNRA